VRPRVFKYKLPPRPPKQPLNRIAVTNEGERLTGFVQGKEASDLEERFARALTKAGREFRFQVEVTTAVTIPGEENQVDFLVDDIWPTEVDGTFTHKTGSQRAHDELRDAIVNDTTRDWGWNPIRRVPGDTLDSQEEADRVVGEMW
jgi:hypothetical protein